MLNLKCIAILGAGVMMIGGCQIVQRNRNSPPEAVSETPLMVDQAMQIRDWDRSSAYYANGDVDAGPTGFWYQAAWNQPEWRYPLEETPLFVGQTLMLPYTTFREPPWTTKRYTGVTVDATYTAMPVLPPSPYAEPMTPAMEPMPEAPTTAPME